MPFFWTRSRVHVTLVWKHDSLSSMPSSNMTVRKVEIERLSVISSKPFEEVLACLEIVEESETVEKAIIDYAQKNNIDVIVYYGV